MTEGSKLVCVYYASGQLQAQIIKSHLESEGIPVLLKYESAGPVFGLTVDGLGEVRVMVPEELAEAARQIIEPMPAGEGGEVEEG